VLGFGLAQFGLQGESVADGDAFSGRETGNDFDGAVIFAADADLAGLEATRSFSRNGFAQITAVFTDRWRAQRSSTARRRQFRPPKAKCGS
jgi:hypothetical protein